MKKQHLLLSLVLAAFGLLPLTTAAAAKDKPAGQRLKERQQPRAKKIPPKRAQKRPQPGASAKASAKAVVDSKVSTDTESRITQAGDYSFSIQHGGAARTYRVHVPARYDPSTPAPLLVALHGGGRSMEDQANDSFYGLAGKSDREGFIAVFPSAYGKAGDGKSATWNAGNCCGSARDQNVDDVGFIRQVVTNVFRQMSIERGRIYATGMSRNDSNVLFAGGAVADAADKSKVTNFTSVADTVAKWAQLNGCTATPRRILDKGGAYCEAYSWCRGQAEVQLCVTDSGGHSWPGGKQPPGGESPSPAISATDMMWAFFSRH